MLLGLAMGVAVVAAVAVVRFVPLATGDLDGAAAVVSFLGRWPVAAAQLGGGVALLVHYVYSSSIAFLAGGQADACIRTNSGA